MPSPVRPTAAPTGRPRRPLAGRPRLVLAALAGLLAAASGLSAQSASAAPGGPTEPPARCERIDSIAIRNNSLFAPEEIQSKNFGWALGAVNHIHYRTRADYLRKSLLVSQGDCYDEAALQASVRNIRDLSFIARAEATSTMLQDSTWMITLETWDEWSTTANIDFDVENSLQFKGFLLAESNAFGRGLKASFRGRTFREQRNYNFTLATTRFLDTRAQASIAGGWTRVGQFWRQDVWRNFQKETPELYFQSRLQYEDREEAYLTGNVGKGLTHVVLPLTDRFWYFRSDKRFGRAGALRVLGVEADVMRRTVTDTIGQVFDRDFGGSTAAPDSLALRLGSQAHPQSWVKLGVNLGIRRIRFTTAKGLDLIGGTQNVAYGTDLTATVGREVGSWGTSPLATYAKLVGYASTPTAPVMFNTRFDAAVRLIDSRSEPGQSQWRDLSLAGRTLLYLRPTDANVLETGVRYDLNSNIDQPFQTSLGGEEGVRGYNEEDLPIASKLVFFAEDRLNLPWFRPAIGLGLTGFFDYGQGWASDVPFAVDTGWRAAVGGGIRIAFPAGSGTVTRLEIAWPIDGRRGTRGPVIRTYWSPIQTRF